MTTPTANHSSSYPTVHVIDFSTVSKSSSPLNPLGAALRNYIWHELHTALANPQIRSIVLTGGANGNFSAGADLTEFDTFLQDPASAMSSVVSPSSGTGGNITPTLVDVVNAIEASDKPVVACITGNCLGGGLEVALACHYRVALAAGKLSMGLPEVRVGVIPGAGGTQRLPRLIGLLTACRLILTGTPVSSAAQALKLQLVDAVVESKQDVLETALRWAHWAETMPVAPRRVGQRKPKESPAEAHVILHAAQLQLPLPQKGGEVPMAAVEALRAAYTTPTLADGMQREGELFLQALLSEQGQAVRHLFFALRTAQKPVVPAGAPSLPTTTLQHPLLTATPQARVSVAVVGAGTMGSGIALVLLRTNCFIVHLVDVQAAALEKGMQVVQQTVMSWVKRGKMSAEQAAQLQHNVRATSSLTDLHECVLVVEAVVENLKIKQQLFQTLSNIVPSSALLVSNTSTLDINAMASALAPASRRAQFAGWHFFSPAHVMPLVEIVVGKETSPATLTILQQITKRIGKTGVVVGNCDGFCGNRLLKPYAAESVLLLTEFADHTPSDIDRAFLDFGMVMGPLQMSDLAGNDVGYNIRKERQWVRTSPNSPIPPNRPVRYTELGDDMVTQLNRLGQKVGKGWYDYNPTIAKGRKALPSPEMVEFLQKYKTASGPNSLRRSCTPEEMIEKVLYPLVNEGFKCLEEGIVRCPSDIDVVYVLGYGFPAWRGGPMHWADHTVTLPVLLQKLQRWQQEYPNADHFVPSGLLQTCVQNNMTLAEYYKRGKLSQMYPVQWSRL